MASQVCVYISYINYSPWLGSEWDFSPTIDDFPLKSSIAVVWVIGDVMIGNVQPTIYIYMYIYIYRGHEVYVCMSVTHYLDD